MRSISRRSIDYARASSQVYGSSAVETLSESLLVAFILKKKKKNANPSQIIWRDCTFYCPEPNQLKLKNNPSSFVFKRFNISMNAVLFGSLRCLAYIINGCTGLWGTCKSPDQSRFIVLLLKALIPRGPLLFLGCSNLQPQLWDSVAQWELHFFWANCNNQE